ncbi:MAG: DUF2182 domain-containing protein [Acidobacteriota bacterium]|nr:DUF2182 domain-containing protein [Acidobacteriota bacterium]
MTPAARQRLRVHVPLLMASGVAWTLLAADPHGFCAMPAMRTTTLAASSALMFGAMMLPLLGAPLLHVSSQSFARRRPRAMALFLAGYGAVWLAAGVALLLAARRIVASPAAVAIAIAAAAVWQCSPLKQRCLNRSHKHPPLAAFAPAADRDALTFGFAHALWCVGSCGALMLVPMLFPNAHLGGMAAMTLWIAGEQLDRPAPVRWCLRWPRKAARIGTGQLRARLRFEPLRRALAFR